MKKAYLTELQSRLSGTVTDASAVRTYFATDGSIFTQMPEAVVYPKNTLDVRRTVQAVAARAEQGKPAGITPRGRGTDQSGAAIGEGVQLVFPAHMNRILRLERDTVTVQPGINYRTLQQTLHTHGRFLPPYPSSLDYSTVGGAVANNAGGEKTVKYGDTGKFVRSLKVVLADGSLIETGRITSRQLRRKMGQSNLEGRIYRQLDGLIEAHAALIHSRRPATSKNSAGYNLAAVRGRDGSFDLTPLMVGSQGTLGVITEMTLQTAAWNPRTTLVVGYLDDRAGLGQMVQKLLKLRPSALELVDSYLLDFVRHHRPESIEGLVPEELPRIVLLAEFDDFSRLGQDVKARRAARIMRGGGSGNRAKVSTDPVEQEQLWQLRHSAAAVIALTDGPKKALPFIEDGVVPVAKLPELLDQTYQLLARHDLDIAVWGHAGDANLHLQPFLDLSKKRDVETLFAVADEFSAIVAKLGGSTAGEHNDGLVRAPYLKSVYGDEMYGLFEQVKRSCDPSNIMNPGKKIGVTEADARRYLRQEYSLAHLSDHLPRT